MTSCPAAARATAPHAHARTRPADAPTLHAARILHDEAAALADDPAVTVDAPRCRAAARSLADALARPAATRRELLAAGPAVLERSGRRRTLVEMLEHQPGDDDSRRRLAHLLLRALVWD